MFNYNKFYSLYEAGSKCEKNLLLEQLKVALYFDYLVFLKTDRDTASDFFCDNFDNIKEWIDAYESKKASFFTYLVFILQRNFYLFQKRKIVKHKMRNLVETDTKDFDFVSDDFTQDFYANYFYKKVSYGEQKAKEKVFFYHNKEKLDKLKAIIHKAYYHMTSSTRNKQVLEKVLICKYACHLPETRILKLSYLLGVDTEWTVRRIDALRAKMQQRFDAQRILEDKLNGYYYQVRLSKKFLQNAKAESYDYNFYKQKVIKSKRWLKKTAKHFLQKNMYPSYKMISEVSDINYTLVVRSLKKLSNAFKELDYDDL